MRQRALALTLTLLGVSACGTKDIDPQQSVVATSQAGPDVGMLTVVFPPTDDTYAAEQARVAANPSSASYDIWMDGQVMMADDGDVHLSPFMVSSGGASSRGYYQAGPHHFTIAVPGHAPIFDGEGEIAAGGITNLFLFGTLDSLAGQFLDTPGSLEPDVVQVIVFNLMRSGEAIEPVQCTDATTCMPLHEPLAGGQFFVADLPAGDLAQANSTLGDDGAGYGFRLVPSASVPNPPVQPLRRWFAPPNAPEVVSFLGAPIYMSDQGDPQSEF
jgi:hypothetical protein